jgi:hypothetical protein
VLGSPPSGVYPNTRRRSKETLEHRPMVLAAAVKKCMRGVARRRATRLVVGRTLEGWNPTGVVSGRDLRIMASRFCGRVKAQESRCECPAAVRRGFALVGNGMWVLSDGDIWIPVNGPRLQRGQNPGVLPRFRSRLGFEGSKPSRGYSNPEGGT